MLKVFIKIPGVNIPHTVMGKKLYEDEKYLVLVNNGLKTKVLWENILYHQEVVDVEEVGDNNTPSGGKVETAGDLKSLIEKVVREKQQRNIQNDVKQQKITNGATPQDLPTPLAGPVVDAAVIFNGYKEQVFKVSGIPAVLLQGTDMSPELSRYIVNDPQIKVFMGDFIFKKMSLKDGNIYIETAKLESKQNDFSQKIDMMKKVSEVAQKTGYPGLAPTLKVDDSFALLDSPFDKPITLSKKGEEDVSVGEEETTDKE